MNYEKETKNLMDDLLTSEGVIPKQESKTRRVAEQVRVRRSGNAGNHPQYSQQDRLAAINKLIDGE